MPKGGKPAKRRSASFEELQAVDWNTVTKSKKVKYDPNRLIFGATEDGFMELEEVDMDEVNGMLGVTGGGGVASKAKDTSPSTPEDDAEPIKGAKKAVTKKTKADVAGKKASAEKKQSAAASLRRRSASFEELQAVDWDKMTKSTPIKYDPNRLIFGATEDGFMELEEVDMDEVNAMAVGGAAAPGKSGGQRQDVHSEANAADDDDDATAAGDDTSDGKPMSAKDARIAKRKARWKAKVEAAKQRKAEARAQAANARGGGAKTDKSSSRNADEDAEERYLSDESDDASDDDDAQDQAQDAASKDAGKATALTAEAKGDAKDQGWQMDYNNYPTAGMGAVVDGVDLDAGADVSNWLQFDLHPALLRALQDMKFTDPTPIQNDCLNPAIKGRCDVIGAAETGSGKTLAFGLPILHRILTQRDEEADESASDSESESIDKGKGGGGDGDANEGAEGAEEKADEDDPFALDPRRERQSRRSRRV
jgi:ATP-dependent RNA helicase DDX24/MAK5